MEDEAMLLAPDDLLAAADGRPLWSRLASGLAAAIDDERLPAGARLENEVALAARLGLSRPTVRRAMQELVDRGLVVRRRGAGTQVVHGRVDRPVALTSLFDDLARAGRDPRTEVLGVDEVPADPAAADRLGLPEGVPVLRLRRLRSADGAPLALLTNWLPAGSGLRAADLESNGLYDLLRARGTVFRVARQRIGARSATAEEGALLQVPRHAALLVVDRTAYDDAGRAVEHGHHVYRPDRYAFETTLVDRPADARGA